MGLRHSVGALMSPPPYTPGLMHLNWPKTQHGPLLESSMERGGGKGKAAPQEARYLQRHPEVSSSQMGFQVSQLEGAAPDRLGWGSVQGRNEVIGLGPPQLAKGWEVTVC